MKEFAAQTGGRYTYVDDVMNLQELALAFSAIFDDCDNFIISGCEAQGSSVTPGYVYLNGKIRYFNGANGVSDGYIYENNSSENISYKSGGAKVGRYIYGCIYVSSIPSNPQPNAVTGTVPAYINISTGLRMREALFGKYSLLLETTQNSQTISGVVNFNNNVNINKGLRVVDGINIAKGNGNFNAYYEHNDFIVSSQLGSGSNNYKIKIIDNQGIKVYVNDSEICSITENSLVVPGSLTANTANIGAIQIRNNELNLLSTSVLKINQSGSSAAPYRNTIIGNGKSSSLLYCMGEQGIVRINGQLDLAGTSKRISLLGPIDSNETKFIDFSYVDEREGTEITQAQIGYTESSNQDFYIINNTGGINITAKNSTYVNIAPVIKEGGVLLSTRYLTRADFTTAHETKANVADVYSKTAADSIFARLDGGFTQFVDRTNTQSVLRQQIGALGSSDVQNVYARIDQMLADVATTTAKKATVRDNIGAQAAIPDNGWQQVYRDNNHNTTLYARQIGPFVFIQGNIFTLDGRDRELFSINGIVPPPAHDAACHTPGHQYGAYIKAGQTTCYGVDHGDSHDIESFTMVYIAQGYSHI